MMPPHCTSAFNPSGDPTVQMAEEGAEVRGFQAPLLWPTETHGVRVSHGPPRRAGHPGSGGLSLSKWVGLCVTHA